MKKDGRITLAEDLVLDFSGLFTGGPHENLASKMAPDRFQGQVEYKTTSETQTPAEGLAEGLEREQVETLFLYAQREREDRQRSLEVYKKYQESAKASAHLQRAILNGLENGEDIYSLFLLAAKAVSAATSNNAFYSQVESALMAIYGRGLREKPPLQMELQGARKRLQRLLEAEQMEQMPDSRERIHRAIEAHRKTIEDIEAMMERGT